VLAVPPDQTREHSRAGELTCYAGEYYGDRLKAVLPAVGTHTPMRQDQIAHMFPACRWICSACITGEPMSRPLAKFPRSSSRAVGGKLSYAWPAQVNRLISQGGFDLILSIGQVVPHEVIGMANYTKNILIGAGGRESINRSHYLGAVYGMERIMGRADNPVRSVLNYASGHFLRHLPIVYVLTVVGRRTDGGLAVRGLFIGDDIECFHLAAELSLKVNFEILDQPIRKAVVYLDPHEFHSTWLGNKAVYRTRMALADDAELIILAPGVKEFGEDKTIDALIRKYGYRGTPATLEAVQANADIAGDLSAAAHLIHASSEVASPLPGAPDTSPGRRSRSRLQLWRPQRDAPALRSEKLTNGYNLIDGEEVFFISNPGLGLWAHRSRL